MLTFSPENISWTHIVPTCCFGWLSLTWLVHCWGCMDFCDIGRRGLQLRHFPFEGLQDIFHMYKNILRLLTALFGIAGHFQIVFKDKLTICILKQECVN